MPRSPRNRPVSPPIVKSRIKPSAYSIGASNEIVPLCKVASQLNTLIADGTATMKLKKENTRAEKTLSPATNMWWPQTRKPITAIATDDQAIK